MIRSIALFVLATSFCFAGPLDETRYCGVPDRDSRGVIKRSSAVRAEFKSIHPCPVTGLPSGPCPGWQIDHVMPLDCGGCDSVSNMQWLPVEIKTCAGTICKDRWERKIYGGHVAGTDCAIPPIE